MALLSGQRLLVVDTETTGLDPAGGHVLVEVATVTIDDAAIGETWSSLIQPGRSIPAEAAAVHGITDTLVADAPPGAPGAWRARPANCRPAPPGRARDPACR